MSDRLLPAPVGLNAEFYAFLARGGVRYQPLFPPELA